MEQIYLESYFKSGYRRLMSYVSNIAHLDKKIQFELRKLGMKTYVFPAQWWIYHNKSGKTTGVSTPDPKILIY